MKKVVIVVFIFLCTEIAWAGCGDTKFFNAAGYYVMNHSNLEYLSTTECGYALKNTKYSSSDAMKEVLSFTNENKKEELFSFFNGPEFKNFKEAGKLSIDQFIAIMSKELDIKTACGMELTELLRQNEKAEKIWGKTKKRCTH